jgi:hypothetical protein
LQCLPHFPPDGSRRSAISHAPCGLLIRCHGVAYSVSCTDHRLLAEMREHPG